MWTDLKKWLFGANRKPLHQPPQRWCRPSLEALEDRIAPAMLTVTSAADNGAGTLRAELALANNGDTIDFNIPGMGVQKIALATPLPAINASVTIDGTSQPGYNGTPLIQIDGGLGNGVAGDALNITAANVTVKGLSITEFFSGAAIDLTNANGGCTVQADYLGVYPDGKSAGPNQYGVKIFGSAGNTITGDVISGNYTGVWIQGAGSTQNSVTSCYIGTNAAGTAAVANGNPLSPGSATASTS